MDVSACFPLTDFSIELRGARNGGRAVGLISYYRGSILTIKLNKADGKFLSLMTCVSISQNSYVWLLYRSRDIIYRSRRWERTRFSRGMDQRKYANAFGNAVFGTAIFRFHHGWGVWMRTAADASPVKCSARLDKIIHGRDQIFNVLACCRH